MTKFGLSVDALQAIIGVFVASKRVTRVTIFGSRALGRQHHGSDIDLALEGNELNLDYCLGVRLKLEDLMLPYRFDLVNLLELDADDDLREHINRVGVVIFDRKN